MRRHRLNKQIRLAAMLLVMVCVAAGFMKIIDKNKDNHEGEASVESDLEKAVDGEESKEKAEASNASIRVLLMTTGYAGTVHSAVSLEAADGLRISAGDLEEDWEGGIELSLNPDDGRFEKGNIRIEAKNPENEIQINSIERGYGTPSYAGVIELRTTAEGIVIINELPVEQYLCKVVPSEMPASYELEALKAQAVCARSYAYRHMQSYAYPEYEAHVNDSVSHQVYGDSQAQESSSKAVEETEGEVVLYEGEPISTYYYSTSCGKTTSVAAWGTKESDANAYLQSVEVKDKDGDYEKDLPWYRWEASIPIETLSNLIGLNTGTDVGTLSSVEITEKGPGDVALQIKATGDKGSVTVETENKIRRALGGTGYTIVKQDGSEAASSVLLPSAFITIEKQDQSFVIKGGGFGHGIGMSQNGANEMAKKDKDYQDILKTFYTGVEIGYNNVNN